VSIFIQDTQKSFSKLFCQTNFDPPGGRREKTKVIAVLSGGLARYGNERVIGGFYVPSPFHRGATRPCSSSGSKVIHVWSLWHGHAFLGVFAERRREKL